MYSITKLVFYDIKTRVVRYTDTDTDTAVSDPYRYRGFVLKIPRSVRYFINPIFLAGATAKALCLTRGVVLLLVLVLVLIGEDDYSKHKSIC